MTKAPLRVLCLDIEGGYGGSSRSLFEALSHIDRMKVEPEVWCRKAGPVQERYREEGIPTQVEPEMPTVSSLEKFSRNLYVYTKYLLRDWQRSSKFREQLFETLERRFDLLHCNHEALFLVALWLQNSTNIPITFHIRTNLHDSVFARQQVNIVDRSSRSKVFITENERAHFERLLGRKTSGAVIYNPASVFRKLSQSYKPLDTDPRYKVACLSNYSWNRGVDRLVDIAVALSNNRRRDILFVVAGNMKLPRSLPGALGRIARKGGSLADYAVLRGVGEMFAFLGHVNEPERVLASSDALIKPTREANPWGRDIIEALAMARPVITLGSWDGFVRQGDTGILHGTFDAEKLAVEISALADDRSRSCTLGANGQQRIRALCDPRDRAADLAEFWHDVALNVPVLESS